MFRACALCALFSAAASAQLVPLAAPVSTSESRQTFVYKKTPQGELKTHVYLPPGWAAGQKRAAIVMFFGGGFVSGDPKQFHAKAIYLASRGMVAVTPEYRIKNVHRTTPDKCVEDTRSAIRWVRTNAAALGIDAQRLVGSGGSAGATTATLAALTTEFQPAGEDASISTRPNALVLYNPALAPHGTEGAAKFLSEWKVAKGDPPMVFFFGSADKFLDGSRAVAAASARLGNRVELYTAAGLGHGFFNDAATAKNGVPGWHDVVLYRTDLFLASLGYLEGPPTVVPKPSLALIKEPL